MSRTTHPPSCSHGHEAAHALRRAGSALWCAGLLPNERGPCILSTPRRAIHTEAASYQRGICARDDTRHYQAVRVVKDGHALFGHSMYGEEAQYSINLTQISPRERSSSKRVLNGAKAAQIGMWQVPQQFECLVRALVKNGPFRRSVCVGTWSGWTDAMLAAYLRRLSPGNVHTTFDVSDYTSPCIKSLFATMDVRMVKNGWYGGRESWPALGLQAEWDGSWPANFSQPVLDFCMPRRPRTPASQTPGRSATHPF